MALPGLVALQMCQCWDPAAGRVGSCGSVAARGRTFSISLSHVQVPVQEGPRLGLGHPLSLARRGDIAGLAAPGGRRTWESPVAALQKGQSCSVLPEGLRFPGI